jgi:hypothetical protein
MADLYSSFEITHLTTACNKTGGAVWIAKKSSPYKNTNVGFLLYFGILGWIYINTFNIYPSPPLKENT